MEISNLIPHIEALVFASDKPLSSAEITELINLAFGFMEDKIVQEQVDAALEGIVEKYNSEFYPFEVKESGGGWQFLTKKDFHKTVAQLNGEKFLKRLSAAALETLAIIAYKQPVTKGEVEAIRGVSSDYAVQKLLEKELIIISGRNEKMPGHPLVYATSKNFMDYFGINSADDLPKIKEVLANQMVEPTVVNHTEFEQSDTLAVSDDGELIGADKDFVNGHSFEPGSLEAELEHLSGDDDETRNEPPIANLEQEAADETAAEDEDVQEESVSDTVADSEIEDPGNDDQPEEDATDYNTGADEESSENEEEK
jgi:segregation and condensation protein B